MTHHRLGTIDWQALITDLHRARLRAAAIATKVGVVRTTVIAIRDDGRTPLYPTGEHLIQLWCEITHRDRDRLPRVSVAESATDPAYKLSMD